MPRFLFFGSATVISRSVLSLSSLVSRLSIKLHVRNQINTKSGRKQLSQLLSTSADTAYAPDEYLFESEAEFYAKTYSFGVG